MVSHAMVVIFIDFVLSTSWLTNSYIGFTLKMESVSKNTIFDIKMMVKSGLEKIILKSQNAGNYFSLLHKSAQITNSVIKITIFPHGGISK